MFDKIKQFFLKKKPEEPQNFITILIKKKIVYIILFILLNLLCTYIYLFGISSLIASILHTVNILIAFIKKIFSSPTDFLPGILYGCLFGIIVGLLRLHGGKYWEKIEKKIIYILVRIKQIILYAILLFYLKLFIEYFWKHGLHGGINLLEELFLKYTSLHFEPAYASTASTFFAILILLTGLAGIIFIVVRFFGWFTKILKNFFLD